MVLKAKILLLIKRVTMRLLQYIKGKLILKKHMKRGDVQNNQFGNELPNKQFIK